MKSLFDGRLSLMRREHPAYGWGDAEGGYFVMNNLRIIASNGEGWDHVSVSLPDRCPTWIEMSKVKEAFFSDDECVIQYHPPKANYVNNHEFTLHLWRPQQMDIPMPPTDLV